MDKTQLRHPALNYSFEELMMELEDRKERNIIDVCEFGSLRLYTYTRHCQYERLWDEVAEICRGLILDIDREEIVALPFPKFYNFGEMSYELPDEPFQVFEKYDGSLGIAYYHNDQWWVATKGSFFSDQAQWATKKLRQHVPSFMIPGNTYLFEIIYPENRIVIDYNKEALILLAAYNNTTGEEFYPLFEDDQLFENCKLYNYNSVNELVEVAQKLSYDNEGFVVRFQNGYRIKVKGKEYLRIHKIISQVTPLGVWRLLIMNQGWCDLEFKQALPEEILADYLKIKNNLVDQCERTYQDAYNLYRNTYRKVGKIQDEKQKRKLFVEQIKDSPLFGYVMAIYGGTPEQGVRAKILRSIRPVGDKYDYRSDS